MLPLGFAFGLVFIPLQTASFARISLAQTGRATAAYNAVRQFATSFGFALLRPSSRTGSRYIVRALGAPATRGGAVAAFHETLLAPALLSALAFLVAALLIRDYLAAETMRRVPVADSAAALRARPVAVE